MAVEIVDCRDLQRNRCRGSDRRARGEEKRQRERDCYRTLRDCHVAGAPRNDYLKGAPRSVGASHARVISRFALSLRLYADLLQERYPLRALGLDERSELFGRAADRLDAELEELGLHRRIEDLLS